MKCWNETVRENDRVQQLSKEELSELKKFLNSPTVESIWIIEKLVIK